MVDAVTAVVPASHRDPAVEHRHPARHGEHLVRGDRHGHRLVHRTHRRSRPARLGGARRVAGGDPRFRRELRMGLDRAQRSRLPRRGARDDARVVPARLPPRRGEPARRRSRARGNRAWPRTRAHRDVLAGHARGEPRPRSSAARSSWRSPCSPSTAPSRSFASRPSPRRSSPSSTWDTPRPACGPPLARARAPGLFVLGGEAGARGRSRSNRSRRVPLALDPTGAAAAPLPLAALLGCGARARRADRHARLLDAARDLGRCRRHRSRRDVAHRARPGRAPASSPPGRPAGRARGRSSARAARPWRWSAAPTSCRRCPAS